MWLADMLYQHQLLKLSAWRRQVIYSEICVNMLHQREMYYFWPLTDYEYVNICEWTHCLQNDWHGNHLRAKKRYKFWLRKLIRQTVLAWPLFEQHNCVLVGSIFVTNISTRKWTMLFKNMGFQEMAPLTFLLLVLYNFNLNLGIKLVF